MGLLNRLPQQKHYISCLIVSEKEGYLYSKSDDIFIKEWDLKTFEQVIVLKEISTRNRTMVISSKGYH